MPTHLNHLAVAAKDKQQSATFLANLLGLPEPTAWGPFLSVTLDTIIAAAASTSTIRRATASS